MHFECEDVIIAECVISYYIDVYVIDDITYQSPLRNEAYMIDESLIIYKSLIFIKV